MSLRLTVRSASSGTADELVVVEYAYLGDVSGVVADRYRLPDVAGEGGVHVAVAGEADPVAVHDAGFGDGGQEEIERFERFGLFGDEAALVPSLLWCLVGLAVSPSVVLVDEERPDAFLEFGQ